MAKSRNLIGWRIGLSLATAVAFGLTYLGISAEDSAGRVSGAGPGTPAAAQVVFAAGPQTAPPVGERRDVQPRVRVVVLPEPKARTRAS